MAIKLDNSNPFAFTSPVQPDDCKKGFGVPLASETGSSSASWLAGATPPDPSTFEGASALLTRQAHDQKMIDDEKKIDVIAAWLRKQAAAEATKSSEKVPATAEKPKPEVQKAEVKTVPPKAKPAVENTAAETPTPKETPPADIERKQEVYTKQGLTALMSTTGVDDVEGQKRIEDYRRNLALTYATANDVKIPAAAKQNAPPVQKTAVETPKTPPAAVEKKQEKEWKDLTLAERVEQQSKGFNSLGGVNPQAEERNRLAELKRLSTANDVKIEVQPQVRPQALVAKELMAAQEKKAASTDPVESKALADDILRLTAEQKKINDNLELLKIQNEIRNGQRG